MALIARAGVEPREMQRTFNMGLGMIVVVPADAAQAASAALASAQARVVGAIVPRAGGEPSRMVEAAGGR
jgi:phosphoribosylformylglycinamidine cyclo-ligase